MSDFFLGETFRENSADDDSDVACRDLLKYAESSRRKQESHRR